MSRVKLFVLRSLLAGVVLLSVPPTQAQESDLVYSGPDVVKPQLTYKTEPNYSESARKSGLQGNVLMEVTIDENGIPRDPVILSSLGQGLAEEAISCISQWRFKPATKNGRPVKFRATVEIAFRLFGQSFDLKAEERRVMAEAVRTLLARQKSAGSPSDDSVKIMQNLASHGKAAAQYVVGLWEIQGSVLPKDESDGLKLMQRAAKQDYPTALLFLGTANMDGMLVTKDSNQGLAFMRKAATLGSTDAQFELGKRYMDGDGVGVDLGAAKRYLQSCAVSGKVECQSRLQKLSSSSPPPPK